VLAQKVEVVAVEEAAGVAVEVMVTEVAEEVMVDVAAMVVAAVEMVAVTEAIKSHFYNNLYRICL